MHIGYLLTFSIEGNTIEKVVSRFGNVGCQVELGRAIRGTYRIIAKSLIYPIRSLRDSM